MDVRNDSERVTHINIHSMYAEFHQDPNVLTKSHGAHNLVCPLHLLVKEESTPKTDHQVSILLEQSTLVQLDKVSEAGGAVGDTSDSLHLQLVRLESCTGAYLVTDFNPISVW